GSLCCSAGRRSPGVSSLLGHTVARAPTVARREHPPRRAARYSPACTTVKRSRARLERLDTHSVHHRAAPAGPWRRHQEAIRAADDAVLLSGRLLDAQQLVTEEDVIAMTELALTADPHVGAVAGTEVDEREASIRPELDLG